MWLSGKLRDRIKVVDKIARDLGIRLISREVNSEHKALAKIEDSLNHASALERIVTASVASRITNAILSYPSIRG